MSLHSRANLILLLEGLASSGVQMITIRQTVPFVGSSVLTTSIIISCFLGALALGYYRGGRFTEKDYANKLARNLVYSIGLFGIGLSYLFVNTFFTQIDVVTGNLLWLHNPLVHLFIYCLLVMSPLVFFLGQTVPLILNTASEETSKSEATGNATALSTVGNVVGCLLTSLILMYFFGVGFSIFLNCLVLGVCLCVILRGQLQQAKSIVCMTGLLLVATHFLNVKVESSIFAATTPYSNFSIGEHPEGKRLVINGSNASFIDHTQTRGWPYIEIMKRGLANIDLKGKNILVLGAGGFTLTAENDFGADVTYVDIDPEIKPVVEKHFLEKSIKGRFVTHDARHFLLTNQKQWDIIIVDLYSNASTIPMHTSTFEFFSQVSKRLAQDGKAIMNISQNPMLTDPYSINMDHTIRSALARCATDISEYKDAHVSMVYFCSKHDRQKVASLYIDDTTKVAVDAYLASMNTEVWHEQ